MSERCHRQKILALQTEIYFQKGCLELENNSPSLRKFLLRTLTTTNLLLLAVAIQVELFCSSTQKFRRSLSFIKKKKRRISYVTNTFDINTVIVIVANGLLHNYRSGFSAKERSKEGGRGGEGKPKKASNLLPPIK